MFSLPVLAADNVAPQLKAAIEKAKPKLGNLSTWQEEAFLNEVLTSPGRFVRDYATNKGQLTKVVVDTDGIKKYLSFHGSQILKPENMKVLLAVRAPDSCTACVGAVPSIRMALKERLERRGLQVIILSAAESSRDLMELLGAKGAVGWAYAKLRSAEDPEHPGDLKTDLELEVRFPGTAASRIQKEMEILKNDSIEVGMSRLAIDAISELGQKVQLARVGAMEQEGNDGIEIVLTGVTDFMQLWGLKNALQNTLNAQGQGRVVERKLVAGTSTLAVISSLSAPELAQMLGNRELGPFRIQVSSVESNKIQAVFKPGAGT